MNKLSGIILASALLMGAVFSGCGQSKQAASTDAGSAGSAQTAEYVVGTDASYAPFEAANEQKELTGFDMDIIKAVADKGGFKIKLVNTPWEGIFASLQNGDRDIVISAVTITDDRKKEMDFSDPYFDAKQLIAVAKDSTIASFADLKGKKVGVQTATTGDDVISKLVGKDSKDIARFESTPLALKELANGGVEAVVADNGVVINYVKNNSDKGFKTVDDSSFTKEQYGIAVKKGNQALLDKINLGLKKIKEDGTYQKIYDRYFAVK